MPLGQPVQPNSRRIFQVDACGTCGENLAALLMRIPKRGVGGSAKPDRTPLYSQL
jgi:hypothetical protein